MSQSLGRLLPTEPEDFISLADINWKISAINWKIYSDEFLSHFQVYFQNWVHVLYVDTQSREHCLLSCLYLPTSGD